MNYKLLIITLLLLFSFKSQAAEPEVYLRPGVKLGYQFGENGGLVYGFELGLINYKNNFGIQNNGTQTYLFGLLTSYEFCNGFTKLHFGLELSNGTIAVELGPSLYNTIIEDYYGLTIGVNSLYLVTPYIEYSQFFKDNNMSFFQTGGFLKVPIPFGNSSMKFH